MDFAWRPRTRRSATSCAAGSTSNLPKFLAEWGERERGRRRRPTARPASTGSWARWSGAGRGSARLNEGRWAAINWPVEWGGREATVTQNVIYSEEMARARTPGIYNANGLWQIGPMIIRWGTDEQKARWVPEHPRRRRPLVPGLHRARGRQRPRQPAHPRRRATATTTSLNGQKIWISSAHIAKWGLFLVRTDADRHRAGRQARGHHRADRRPRGRRHRVPARSATSPARRCSARCSSPTPACRQPTGSATRAPAGRSPWARSATSGSAPPASPSRCGPTSTP